MIVFYFLTLITFLITSLLVSAIMIDIKKVEIQDIEKLKGICLTIDNKRYDEMFNYIKLEVEIKLVLFSVIPIKFIKINNETIKKIIHRIIEKDQKQKNNNMFEFKTKRNKQKVRIKQIRKRINPYVKVRDANLHLRIGLTNAEVTAIATGILNFIMSILLIDYAPSILEIEKNKNKEQFNYLVEPVYSEDFAFNLESRLKIKFPIYALI